MFQLIYQSQARHPFSTEQLAALLRRARPYNHAERITGLLLYTFDGRFLQVIEGDETTVRHLYYDKIARDPRHHHCTVLGEGPVAHRAFPDWGMGFRAAQAADLEKIVGYFNLTDGRFLLPRAHNMPADILLLLLRFVAEYNDAPWQEETSS
ncbi:BLUF domain-containing protein [Hymenobacter caeli]|uniref:BLUF domain-containing protein n=1 Tax=Hymenobacter caeli TaxID=2735894 RepID=UPI00156FAD95|nr:BLUF domain-containing protein [Hymenobacter caeli]